MTLFHSLALMSATVMLLFFPESTIVFQVVIFVATIVTLNMFLRMMKEPNFVRFGNVTSFSILFGHIVFTAFYTAMAFKEYGHAIYTENVFWFGYSQSIISYAVTIVLIVSILLAAIAHFEKPLEISCHLQNSLSSKSIFLILLSVLVIAFAFIHGDIGYSGTRLLSERRISPLGSLCFVSIPPLTAIVFGSVLLLPSGLQKYRKPLIVTAVFLALAVIPLGRRVMIYTFILSAIVSGPVILERVRARKFNVFKLICMLLVIIFFLGWGVLTFYAIRISVGNIGARQKPSLTEILPYTIDLLKDSYAMAEVQEKLRDNLTQRPFFMLSYFAGLIDAHKKMDTPSFAVLQYSLLMAIPSLLQPDKTVKLAPSTEDIIHPFLGIPVFDGTNTMLTAGLNDLGFIGILLYPVGIVGFYVFLSRLAFRNCPRFLYVFIVMRLLFSILYLEASLGALIGSGLRDLFIVSVFYWFILKVFPKQLPILGAKKSVA